MRVGGFISPNSSDELYQRLLGAPRYELLPLKSASFEIDTLPSGSQVTITCSAQKGLDASLRCLSALSVYPLKFTPHLSARLVRDRSHLQEIVQEFKKFHVESIFVPGGDIATPVGEFDSSYQLLNVLAEMDHPFKEIGVTAYPEGHPLISNTVLWEALEQKQRFSTYMVSQMCFSAKAIYEWLVEARKRGIQLPILIGVPGLVNRAKLMGLSVQIGVGSSISFLSKNTGLLARMFQAKGFDPKDLIKKLSQQLAKASSLEEDISGGVKGLHFYTFNQLQKTENWRQQQLQTGA